MTICAIYKQADSIWMISDSRLTVGQSPIDVGVKISALPYKIFGPTEPDGRTRKVYSEGRIGFCFAGSSLTAYAIKESISEIIANIQTTIEEEILSFTHLNEIIFNAYSHLTKEIGTLLGSNNITQIVTCGKLAQDKSPHVFRLTCRLDGMFDSSEIFFEENHYEIFGSASSRVDPEKCATLGGVIHEVNRIACDSSATDVGPPLQIGHLSPSGGFRCLGQLIIDSTGVKHARVGLDLQLLNSVRSGMFNPLIEYLELSK